MLTFGASVSLLAQERLGEDIPDEDLDGIPDFEDMCPDQPIGSYPDPENEGCPARDRDGDGLVDPIDECPSETMWPYPNPDSDVFRRVTLLRDDVDHFTRQLEFSTDGGESWFVRSKWDYRRR